MPEAREALGADAPAGSVCYELWMSNQALAGGQRLKGRKKARERWTSAWEDLGHAVRLIAKLAPANGTRLDSGADDERRLEGDVTLAADELLAEVRLAMFGTVALSLDHDISSPEVSADARRARQALALPSATEHSLRDVTSGALAQILDMDLEQGGTGEEGMESRAEGGERMLSQAEVDGEEGEGGLKGDRTDRTGRVQGTVLNLGLATGSTLPTLLNSWRQPHLLLRYLQLQQKNDREVYQVAARCFRALLGVGDDGETIYSIRHHHPANANMLNVLTDGQRSRWMSCEIGTDDVESLFMVGEDSNRYV